MGDVREFVLPDLGEGLESGEIVAWHVEVGDHVELNEDICDVETAKAVVSIPCPFAGTVVKRFAEVGEELEVGARLVQIDVEQAASGRQAEPPSGEAAGRPPDREVPSDDEESSDVLVGYGTGRTSRGRRRRQRASSPDGGDGHARHATRPLAKPPVRKLARDLGVDLAAIAPGSGEGGVVTREDVHAAAQAAEAAPATPPRGAPEVTGEPRPAALRAVEQPAGFRGRRPGQVIPVTGIRRRIADKMTAARREIPAASTSVTVDCTPTWELAGRLTDSAAAEGHDVRITPFAVVLRAATVGLRRFPTLNAVLDEDAGEIRLLEELHLGVAVDTDRGLLVAVIRDADRRSVLDLAREVTRLAGAARNGSVSPEELTGSTFTVNNYGALGNDFGDPIINHPEAGILGVGAMQRRPWVVDDRLAVRRTVTLTVAFDHRICDGGEAGRFVTYVGELISDPSRLLLSA